MYPDFDSPARRSATANILVVGAGALGCAAARTLAREPGLSLTILDDDRVELSNLQRQVLYTDPDIGRLKVEAAAERLARDFGATIDARATRFDAATGPGLVADADLVIDATDDPETKFLIGRLCVEARTPYVYGGVVRTGGQWLLAVPGESACLECVYPAQSSAESIASSDSSPHATPSRAAAGATAAGCAALGILAPVAGVVGCMQALTALACLRRPGRATPGRLHLYELGARSRHIDFKPDPACFCSAAFQRDECGHPRTAEARKGAHREWRTS